MQKNTQNICTNMSKKFKKNAASKYVQNVQNIRLYDIGNKYALYTQKQKCVKDVKV